jgi:hypothetical protein
LVVGSVGGAARRPAAWGSPDGSGWQPETVAGVDGDAALERAVPWRGGVLAVGVRGDRFGAWFRDAGGHWRIGAAFGTFGGTGVPVVTGLAAGSGSVYVAAFDGVAAHLWRSGDGDSWVEKRLPADLKVPGPGRSLVVAAVGTQVIVAAGPTIRILEG